MKAKHLITALALPMAFAACSDEQFDGIENNLVSKENRPTVGQVTFADKDIQSRFAMDANIGSLTWQDGDAFGMMMMDEPKATGAITIGTRKYNLVNQAKSNYPFTNNGGVWSSEAELLEGNYFYYFPHITNQKDATKSNVTRQNGLTWILPSDQNAFTAEAPNTLNAYNAVKENQLWVGYQALNADNVETSLENKMVPAFPTIYFKLVNTDESPVVVNRVVLEEAAVGVTDGTSIKSDAFKMKSQLDVENGTSAAITYTSFDKDNDGDADAHTVAADANIATAFTAYNSAIKADRENYAKSPFANMGATSYFAQTGGEATIALNLPETTLAKGQSMGAVMVVPNGGMTLNKLQARIYTNKGLVLVPLTVGKYTVSTVTTGATKGLISYKEALSGTDADAVKSQEASVELKSLKEDNTAYLAQETGAFEKLVPNQGATVTISFNADAISVPGKMDIYKTADLDAFLSYCKAANVTEITNLEATLKGSEIELSKKAYDILNDNDKIKLTVLADATDNTLTISNEITATDALNKLTWDKVSPVVNAIVEEGATQVVSANFANKIFNKGTLTVSHYNNATPAVAQNTTVGGIFNVGTLTVSTPVEGNIINGTLETELLQRTYDKVVSTASAAINANVAGILANYAVATSTASTIAGVRNYTTVKAENDDKVGSITVNGDLTSVFDNNGNLTINAVVKATLLTNEGDITVNAGKFFYIAGTSTSEGDIVNNGTVEILGTFTNVGSFTNNYGLVCQSSGTFTNEGEMTVNAASKYTYISDNTDGEITIYDRKEELRIADGAKAKQGTIIYTAVESDYVNGLFSSKKSDKFNKLIVEKAGADLSKINDVTYTGYVAGDYAVVTDLVLNVNTDSEFTFADKASFNTLEVGKENNTVDCIIQAYANELTISSGLTINKKTTFHITTGNTVIYTGSANINNLGTILVGGTFKVTTMAKPADVTNYKEAGGSIIWK